MYESAIRLRHLLLCFESNSKGQILHQTAITFTVGILQLEGGKHHEMPKSEMNILKKDEDALLFMKYWGKKSLKCMKLACWLIFQPNNDIDDFAKGQMWLTNFECPIIINCILNMVETR